jgi:circadian clock protein KaiC
MANQVSTERISTGVKGLDDMLGGKGLYRGGSVLVSGTAGTGKTSLAASFANEACNRKEKVVYFAMEESPSQIIRNIRSIGIDLKQHVDKGLLIFNASRPNLYGLEMHLVAMHKCIRKYKPTVVVIDPITNFINIGSVSEVKNMLVRMIDFLQEEGISVMFTALSLNTVVNEQTDEGVSSLVDAWILVRDIEFNGERNRGLYVMKSRGMKHSNQVREFVITDKGLNLIDVYLGPDGILTGSAREQQVLLEQTGDAIRNSAVGRKDREISRKRQVLEAKISSLNSEFESIEEELNKVHLEEELKKHVLEKNREEVTRLRRGETAETPKTFNRK